MKRTDVFISYAHADQKWAEKLRRDGHLEAVESIPKLRRELPANLVQ